MRRLVIVSALLVLPLAGCGGGSSTPSATSLVKQLGKAGVMCAVTDTLGARGVIDNEVVCALPKGVGNLDVMAAASKTDADSIYSANVQLVPDAQIVRGKQWVITTPTEAVAAQVRAALKV